MMKLTYLFDPLCGWCYGAVPVLRELAQHHQIQTLPTGLFAEPGRTMSEAFARHAWHNDQRIAKLTGQVFSEAYRNRILQVGTPFDSTRIITALAAVAQTAPEQVLDASHALQHARYVGGRDNTSAEVIADVLKSLGLGEAPARLDDPHTAEQADTAIAQGRALAARHGIQGVPNMIAHTPSGEQVLPCGLLYDARQCLAWLENI